MLKNEYLVSKIGFDTEENEPSRVSSFSLKNTGFYESDLSTELSTSDITTGANSKHNKSGIL